MKHKTLPVSLALLMVLAFAVLASGVVAQEPEYDVFIYLPLIVKPESTTPDCSAYEPNDTPAQANWIQDGETQTQCIIPATDIDWVKFSLSAESEVVIETSGPSGDTRMWLYDSNLNQLEYNDDGGRGLFSLIDRPCGSDMLPPGTYYVKIDEYGNNQQIPSYNITLSVNECPTPVVLPNHSYYITSYSFYVVGEVQNNGEIGISDIDVIANLFNGDDQLIDTGIDYLWRDVLPGDKTCFELSFSDWDGWSYYEFETPTYDSTTNRPLENMTVYGDHGTYDPDDGSYSVLGFVRNDNDFRVEYVRVIATLYTASGTVVGCSYTYVSSTDLNPGQSSSFELRFPGYYRDYADVTSYRTQVDGSPQ